MSKRFLVNDDLTQEVIEGDYWEVGVHEGTGGGYAGVWKYFELASWDNIVQGIAAVYPNLDGVVEITIRKANVRTT